MHRNNTTRLDLSRCYDRIAKREAEVGAFQYLKPESQATIEKNAASVGFLKDMPIGIKDIYDTFDMPTRWGTTYLHSERSLSDASLVATLRQAGASIIGKTVSTELAYFTPGKTRNPHDLDRTPGASSSGSAAAVADGMVQAALGSQTAGSIIRPASFCGVVGFKPSVQIIPTSGIKCFSKTLDTVGWFTNNVDDSIDIFNVATKRRDHSIPECSVGDLTINCILNVNGVPLDEDARSLLVNSHHALDKISGKVNVIELDALFNELVECHKTIMAYEASRTLAYEFEEYRSKMGKELVDIITKGLSIDYIEYVDALDYRDESIQQLHKTFFYDADIVVAPSTIGEATVGLSTTGDPVYCRPWTLLGLPCLHLPIGQGDHGMPIGIQLIGKSKEDLLLLSAGKAITQYNEFATTCTME